MDVEPIWESLPANVLVRVFQKLSLKDLGSCSSVCHQFQTAAQTEGIWKALLQQHYSCSNTTPHATSFKQCFAQLKTATFWSCGTYCPHLQPTLASSGNTTILMKLWSSVPCANPLPLNIYCPALPREFVINAAAAGSNHLVLLSCTGEVIDSRTAAVVAEPAAVEQQGPEPEAVADDEQLALLGLDAYVEHQQQQQQQQQQQPGMLHLLNPWRPPGCHVASIAAGTSHVLAVTTAGSVWGWGSNGCGQLGLEHNSSWQATPLDVTQVMDGAWKAAGDSIISAACGDAHSALLAASGALYTAGCNKQGQCAQGEELQLCSVFCQPPQPLLAATAVACAVANTAIATTTGRLLVCGDSSSGQCGAAWLKAGCCHEFIDIGPELSWHGLTRPSAAQVAAAGGSVLDALPKVVQVAMGSGTGFALTCEGEVYAWGAGSKGQLGRGGYTKVQTTPAKLPWAKHVTQISASLDGAFAAAVDEGGHLYTWGAGKWGQLGHGDTSKRTVGRAVKQLKHLAVLQAVCGSETLFVLTCNRPHTSHNSSRGCCQQGSDGCAPADLMYNGKSSLHRSSSALSAGSSRCSRQDHGGSSTTVTAAEPIAEADCNESGCSGLSCMEGVDWVDIEGQGSFYSPQPKSGYARKGFRAAKATRAAAAAAGSCGPSRSATPSEHVEDTSLPSNNQAEGETSEHIATATQGISSSSKVHRTSSSSGFRFSKNHSSRHSSSGSRCHTDADMAARSAAAAVCEASSSAAAAAAGLGLAGEGGQDHSETGSPGGRRRERMDKGFKRLLKRLLKQFVADSKQRELTFPASLSAADRYYIHVAADEWGLGHASHNDVSGERVIKVGGPESDSAAATEDIPALGILVELQPAPL